jgi:hypothetical protein
MRRRYKILMILILVVAAFPRVLLAALFSLYRMHPTLEAQDWKFLEFGRWTFAPLENQYGEKKPEFSPPELAFRLQPSRLLVAGFHEDIITFPAEYSQNRFSVDIKSGKLGELSEDEWDEGLPVATHVDSPFHPAPKIADGEVLYEGRRFRGRGQSLEGFSLSPDGNWLAISSWDGKNPLPKDLFDITIARGRLFIGVYRVSSGKEITEITRLFFPVFPDTVVRSIRWIADRYLMVPLADGSGAWLCDLRTKEPASTAAWDVIRPGAEILGFDNESDGVHQFLAVRVSEQQFYSIAHRGDLLAWGQLLVPGIRRFSMFRAPESRVQGLELRGHKEETVASAADLGPIADGPQAGAVVSVVPYLGSGAKQTFEFVAADPRGAGKIAQAEFLVQADRTPAEGCLLVLERATGVLRLLDDAGSAPVDAQDGAIRNSHCTVSNAVVSSESEWSVVVRVNVEFPAKFSGRKNLFGRVQDLEGHSSGWRLLGNWTVP